MKKLLLSFSLVLACAAPGFALRITPNEFTPGACSDGFNPSITCSFVSTGAAGGDASWNSLGLSAQPYTSGSGDGGPQASFLGNFTMNNSFNSDVLPVKWDFSVDPLFLADSQGTPFTWNFSLIADTTTLFSTSGSGNLGDRVTGSGATSVLSGHYTSLSVNLNVSSASTFVLNVPAGSTLDINPASTATPEPGTVILGGTALLGLAGIIRRRRTR